MPVLYVCISSITTDLRSHKDATQMLVHRQTNNPVLGAGVEALPPPSALDHCPFSHCPRTFPTHSYKLRGRNKRWSKTFCEQVRVSCSFRISSPLNPPNKLMSQETSLFPFYDWENQGHHWFADSQKQKKGFLCSVFLKVMSHGAPLHDQSFKTFPSQPPTVRQLFSRGWVPLLQITRFVPDSQCLCHIFWNPLSVMPSSARVPPTHSATWPFTFHRLVFAPWPHSPGMQTLNIPSLWPLGSPAASVTHTHTQTVHKQVQLFPFPMRKLRNRGIKSLAH